MLRVEITGCCYAACHNGESCYAECRLAERNFVECHNAECRYAECHGTECRCALSSFANLKRSSLSTGSYQRVQNTKPR